MHHNKATLSGRAPPGLARELKSSPRPLAAFKGEGRGWRGRKTYLCPRAPNTLATPLILVLDSSNCRPTMYMLIMLYITSISLSEYHHWKARSRKHRFWIWNDFSIYSVQAKIYKYFRFVRPQSWVLTSGNMGQRSMVRSHLEYTITVYRFHSDKWLSRKWKWCRWELHESSNSLKTTHLKID